MKDRKTTDAELYEIFAQGVGNLGALVEELANARRTKEVRDAEFKQRLFDVQGNRPLSQLTRPQLRLLTERFLRDYLAILEAT